MNNLGFPQLKVKLRGAIKFLFCDINEGDTRRYKLEFKRDLENGRSKKENY